MSLESSEFQLLKTQSDPIEEAVKNYHQGKITSEGLYKIFNAVREAKVNKHLAEIPHIPPTDLD